MKPDADFEAARVSTNSGGESSEAGGDARAAELVVPMGTVALHAPWLGSMTGWMAQRRRSWRRVGERRFRAGGDGPRRTVQDARPTDERSGELLRAEQLTRFLPSILRLKAMALPSRRSPRGSGAIALRNGGPHRTRGTGRDAVQSRDVGGARGSAVRRRRAEPGRGTRSGLWPRELPSRLPTVELQALTQRGRPHRPPRPSGRRLRPIHIGGINSTPHPAGACVAP